MLNFGNSTYLIKKLQNIYIIFFTMHICGGVPKCCVNVKRGDRCRLCGGGSLAELVPGPHWIDAMSFGLFWIKL